MRQSCEVHPIKEWVVAMLLVSIGALVGCRGESRMDVVLVTGSVTFRGRPAEGAEVSFIGLDEALLTRDSPFPRATCTADGTFSLTSYETGDGAPPGRYRVTIVWKKSRSDDPELADDAPDVLGGRYASATDSPLVAEVETEPTHLPPFELK